MPTQKAGYFTKAGERVPSVTTVLSRFKESGALIHWAAGQAAEYVRINLPEQPTKQDVARLCEMAKGAYREVSGAAADAGTLAHSMIEAEILNRPVAIAGTEETVRKAKSAFDAYMSWAQSQQVEYLWTERPFVSERLRTGGTPDALGMIGGSVMLLDWKTSNAVYGDYLIQLAAYRDLIEESEPLLKIKGFYLCRFAKENGDFAVHYFPELAEASRMFALLREAYEIDKTLKKRAA